MGKETDSQIEKKEAEAPKEKRLIFNPKPQNHRFGYNVL